MTVGELIDTFDDIIALARNGEIEEIIAICECEKRELNMTATNEIV